MEISSLNPYHTQQLAPESENQATGSQVNSLRTEVNVPEVVDNEDRLELVRAQNLVSPAQEDVDLARAAELLQQVQDQLQTMDKQEARELYQFDRLRDLLYRVSQPDGV